MWPPSEESLELVRLAASGKIAARDAILERHRDPLRRFFGQRIDPKMRKRCDASDLVQEVLADAAARFADYAADPRLPFHLWLRRIATDRFADAVRRHRGAGQRSVDREETMAPRAGTESGSVFDLHRRVEAAGLTPAAALIRRELADGFRAALAELPEPDREIILMRHAEGLSNLEVAKALGLEPPATAMRYLRAIRRLRPLLAGVYPESR